MTTRQEALRGAALVLVEACSEIDSLSSRAVAEAAWYPGHRLGTVDAIEELIVRQRQDAITQAQATEQHPLAA